MALLLLIKNERVCWEGFSAPLLPQCIYYLKERGWAGDKGVASDSQGCDRTAEPRIWWGHALGTATGVRAQQGSKSHPCCLLPGPSGAGISDFFPRSSWEMDKAGIHHPARHKGLSSDRLIWSLVFWTVCVFHREKNNFPLKDLYFFFFCQIFPKFQLFFFLAIASILSSRETQRSKSLLHLSPKSPSHFWKAGCSWGIAFPVCKFSVTFLLHLQICNPLVFNMICTESTAEI